MTVSDEFREAAFAQETDAAPLFLLQIDDDSLSEPIRVVNNQTDIVSNGETYVGLAFEIGLPSETDDQSRVTIRIDNVDRVIVDSLRAVTGRPVFTLSVVLADTPDLVEAGPYEMTLSEADYDAGQVTGVLVFDDILAEPFPGDSFIPSTHAGMF